MFRGLVTHGNTFCDLNHVVVAETIQSTYPRSSTEAVSRQSVSSSDQGFAAQRIIGSVSPLRVRMLQQ
jgi:hypothetical protein